MQKYREINGNDYVKDSRATINETMQSIQSMNSGTAFPTTNLFEGMKCYRTDLKKTYTLTDVENGTWVEDAHATLSDEATHAAAADTATTASNVSEKIYYSADSPSVATNKLFTVKQAHAGEDNVPNNGLVIQSGPTGAAYNGKLYITDNGVDGVWIGGIAAGKEVGWTRLVENRGSWNINSATATKFATARKINITGNASGSAAFDGTNDVSINVSVSQAAHADKATADANGRSFTDTNAYMHISALADNTDFNNVKTTGIYYCTGNTYSNRPHNSWGILTVYSIGTVKQEYKPDNAAVYYTREYNKTNWTEWSKVNAANADTATKLATARAISLTGNASGSANFDGSGNVSINTTVNESKHAAAATALETFADRPADANIQKGDGLVRYFLATSNMTSNKPLGDAQILHLAWDNNGGWDAQLAIAGVDGDIQARSQNAGKWGAWKTFLNDKNYNDYAPTKTGGGASGTWGINISGNANSATKWNGLIDDHNTENNTDTWIPVFVDGKMQHTDRTKMTVGNADTVDGYHASDIINRISAANTGGIVAASLTENGYVKFANGLILQWGFVSNTKAAKNYDITFPVSFASACFGVHNTYFKSSGEAGKSGDNWDTVAKITKYGCQLSADNQNVFWTAIGV